MSEGYDLAAPAWVFIASAHTSPARKRVLWKTTIGEAMAICSDDRTASSHSMLVWTAQFSPDDQGKTWQYVADDGRYAGLLAELGVTVAESKATLAA